MSSACGSTTTACRSPRSPTAESARRAARTSSPCPTAVSWLMDRPCAADPDHDMDLPMARDGQAVAMGAEALLREHPDALVCGLAANGLIVPVPQSVGLWGQGLIAGRALIDNVVAADRATVVRVWLRAQEEGAASDK